MCYSYRPSTLLILFYKVWTPMKGSWQTQTLRLLSCLFCTKKGCCLTCTLFIWDIISCEGGQVVSEKIGQILDSDHFCAGLKLIFIRITQSRLFSQKIAKSCPIFQVNMLQNIEPDCDNRRLCNVLIKNEIYYQIRFWTTVQGQRA